MSSDSLISRAKEVSRRYNTQHHFIDDSGYTVAGKTNIVSNVMLAALFVIGVVAASGMLSAAAVGWAAVGLGGVALVVQLAGGALKERRVDLILAAIIATALITVGVLGGVGVLSGAQVGYSLIGILVAQSVFYCCCCRALTARSASISARSASRLGGNVGRAVRHFSAINEES